MQLNQGVSKLKMIKMIGVLAMAAIVSACSSHAPNSNYEMVIGNKNPEVMTASFVQWNAEYAVTAKHNKYPESPEYVSETVDLVFFKNKPNDKFNPAIEWRNPKADEEVIHVGPKANGLTVELRGTFIKDEVEFKDGRYAISSSRTIGGMSGGPVYSADKTAILGMSVGRDQNIKINDVVYENVAVFVDSGTIQEEWDKFQKQ